MQTPRTILLLFEDERISLEGLVYSLELAHRMGCELGVLMLVGPSRGKQAAATRARFEARLGELVPAGAPLEAELGTGDKPAQLLAYVTRHPAVGTLVWGGDQDALGERGGHWLAGVRSELCCPIVIPKSRRVRDPLGERESLEGPCS